MNVQAITSERGSNYIFRDNFAILSKRQIFILENLFQVSRAFDATLLWYYETRVGMFDQLVRNFCFSHNKNHRGRERYFKVPRLNF